MELQPVSTVSSQYCRSLVWLPWPRGFSLSVCMFSPCLHAVLREELDLLRGYLASTEIWFTFRIINVMFSPASIKHPCPCVPASSISIKEQSSSLVLCPDDRWVQLLQAQQHFQGSCPWSVGSVTVSATQTCNGTHLDYKVFCQLEEEEEEEGVRKSIGRKLKSRANCGACFPVCLWQLGGVDCASLTFSPSLPLSLALIASF